MIYDAVYLSPHLDDVALSCGAQIFDRTSAGQRVLIVTMMAGDPPVGLSDLAQQLHARWQLAADAVAARREEDAAACRILGAAYAHWGVLDCIYRTHPETAEPLYATNAAIFGEVHPADRPLIGQLAQQFDALPAHREVVAPLTIGHHVDHQLVRLAAEQCFGKRLSYYDDYPYVRWEAPTQRALPVDAAGWQAQVVPVSAAGVRARITAVAAFASQVGSFFRDQADLEAQLTAQVQSIGGERLWRRAGAGQ